MLTFRIARPTRSIRRRSFSPLPFLSLLSLGLVKLNSCVFSFNFSAKKERERERKVRVSFIYIYIYTRLYAKQVDTETVDDQREARLKNISLAHNKIGEERMGKNEIDTR